MDVSGYIDDVRGNMLIKNGLLLSSEIVRRAISSVSSWNISRIAGDLPITGSGMLDYEIASQIRSVLESYDVYVAVWVSNDVIVISSNDPNYIQHLLRRNRDEVFSIYMDAVKARLERFLGRPVSYNEVLNVMGGSLKIVFLKTPYEGYKSSEEIISRFDKYRDIRPEFLGGLSYNALFGHYSFLIYLSCRSEVFNYSYSIDQILPEMDRYLTQLFGGEYPKVVLMVLEKCVAAYPDSPSSNADDNRNYSEKPRFNFKITPVFTEEYVISLQVGESTEEGEYEIDEPAQLTNDEAVDSTTVESMEPTTNMVALAYVASLIIILTLLAYFIKRPRR